MLVNFFKVPTKIGLDEQGFPEYADVTFIRIVRDMTHTVERQAEEEDFETYPKSYAFFLNQHAKEVKHGGLGLEMWPVLTPAEVMNFRGREIHTVQQLAKLDKKGMPPALAALVDEAKTYVAVAGDAGKLAAKVADLSSANKALEDEVRDLRAVIKKFQEAPKAA